jgi:hypothetical protein
LDQGQDCPIVYAVGVGLGVGVTVVPGLLAVDVGAWLVLGFAVLSWSLPDEQPASNSAAPAAAAMVVRVCTMIPPGLVCGDERGSPTTLRCRL